LPISPYHWNSSSSPANRTLPARRSRPRRWRSSSVVELWFAVADFSKGAVRRGRCDQSNESMKDEGGKLIFISRAVDGNCYPKILFASLEQRKHLCIRTIRIPRTSQLATRAHVLADPAQYRTHDRLARIKFSA